MTLDSMKEWLASWGDGPHWDDSTGVTVPVTKESLRAVLASAEKMRTALLLLQQHALHNRQLGPAAAASIATICEDALKGV